MRRAILALALGIGLATPASAERLISALSTSRVLIASNFTGADVVLFGAVERDAQTVARRGGYDIVVTVTGPRETIVTVCPELVETPAGKMLRIPAAAGYGITEMPVHLTTRAWVPR